MASSSYHSGAPSSYHSSGTDDDLEEARQRLLAHQYEPDTEPEETPLAIPPGVYQRGPLENGAPARILITEPSNADNNSRGSRYGSVSAYPPQRKPHPRVKRYRLPLLILLGFDWGLVVFLSVICFVLLVRRYIHMCGGVK